MGIEKEEMVLQSWEGTEEPDENGSLLSGNAQERQEKKF